jgi:O-antigen/teichoic acid export membrane protein
VFAKGLIGYLPANALQGVVGFASLMAFTRLLSPEDYGRYAMAFGLTSLGHTVAFTWIEAAMARFYPAEGRDNPEAPLLYGTLYRLFAMMAGLMLGLSLIVAIWPMPVTLNAFRWAVVAGLISAIARSLCKLIGEQRRSEGRVTSAASLDMLQTAGGFAIAVGLCLLGLGASAPLLGAGLIALISLALFAREDWGRAYKGRFDPVRAKAYAHYGFPLSLSLILTLILFTADRFLIARYLGEGDSGAYHAGVSLASRIIDVLFIWLGAAGTPALVHALESGGPEALKTAARKQITTIAYFTFPATAGLIAVAPSLGGLLIGEALRERALLITPMIALGALFSGLNSYYLLSVFTLARRTRLLMLAMSLPAVANIALNLWLIPQFGLMGAALASLTAFVLGSLSAILLGQRTGLNLPLPLGELSRTALAATAMLVILVNLPDLSASFGMIVELFVKSVSGVCLFGFFACGMNLNETRQTLRRQFSLRISRSGTPK